MNFLYCLDNNFNLQALNSINSIIRNSENKDLKFYIIHDTPEGFKKIIDKYLPSFRDIIHIYKFDFNAIKFPKISGAHVSKATYFRLFFQEYIPANIDFITYIDSDIICLSNPDKRIKYLTEIIENKNYLLGAVNDSDEGNQNKDRLGMSSDKYFNAGVMVINLKLWRSKIEIHQLITSMQTLKDKILWWDQDVLNVLIDGEFLEIEKDFNMKVSNIKEKLETSVVFLHYAGKRKPWDNSIFYDIRNSTYQEAFSFTGFSKYHVHLKGIPENIKFFKNIFLSNDINLNKFDLLHSYIKNKLI
jgi:lipopolysaccharide biosynthesis glycosyltransferase